MNAQVTALNQFSTQAGINEMAGAKSDPASKLIPFPLENTTSEYKAKPLTLHQISEIASNAKVNPMLGRVIAASSDVRDFCMRPDLPPKLLTTKYDVSAGNATDQARSGRCWIFSALNRMRIPHVKTYGADFNFSANFVAFWDKFERANYILSKMIEYKDLDPKHPLITNLLEQVWGDGGEWELFVNIVGKFGIVPDWAMPETKFSGNSDAYMKVLSSRVGIMAGFLHKEAKTQTLEKVEELKIRALHEVFRILCYFLGVPPKEFDWKMEGEEDYKSITPVKFYELMKTGVQNKVHLTCLPYLSSGVKTLVKDVSNMVGGLNLRSLNVDVKDLKQAVRNSLKAGEAVDFSCAVSVHNDPKRKLMSVDNDETGKLFEFDPIFNLDKGDRLLYRVDKLSHMMVFVGCNEPSDEKAKEGGADKSSMSMAHYGKWKIAGAPRGNIIT